MEKEMRNLRRITDKAGRFIKVPNVYFCRQNIIFMEMIGNEELCAPRVKDLNLSHNKPLSVTEQDYNDNTLVSTDDNYIDKSMQIKEEMIRDTQTQLKYELFVKSFV